VVCRLPDYFSDYAAESLNKELAAVYDEMTADPEIRKFYQYWRKLLLQTISERKLKVRTLVDLMCGTGNMDRTFLYC